MPAFLVRVIDTRDLVGFFFANGLEELAIIIDEAIDPDDCEYIRIGSGGIMWSGPAIAVPITWPDEDDHDSLGDPDPLPWSGASVSEEWWDYVYRATDARWRPVIPRFRKRRAPRLPQRSQPATVLPFRKRPK
jgi:hypothetical protein